MWKTGRPETAVVGVSAVMDTRPEIFFAKGAGIAAEMRYTDSNKGKGAIYHVDSSCECRIL